MDKNEMPNQDRFESHWQHKMFHRHTHRHGWFGAMQARRGDMRPIILGVLQEKPMHGYEIMRQLEEKSHGMWRPSPGSIYPTLQMLEEQDLVTSEAVDGKKVYSLTEKGREEAKKTELEIPKDFERNSSNMDRKMEFRSLIADTMTIMKEIARHGSDEDFEKVKTVLAEARDKLAAIRPSEEE